MVGYVGSSELIFHIVKFLMILSDPNTIFMDDIKTLHLEENFSFLFYFDRQPWTKTLTALETKLDLLIFA